MKLVSVILPTLNERGNIIPLIKTIQRTVKKPLEIIVVDDNSPDGTSELVSKYIKESKKVHVRLITKYEDRGLTNSLKDGIRAAKGDVIVWMDCDFSMPAQVINQLMEKIREGYDIAAASRFVKGGGFKRGKNDFMAAIVLSRLMNYSIQFFLGGSFKDYTSGFVAVRKKVLEKIDLRGDYGEYFIDFIYRALAHKFKVVEIPYVCLPRDKGESKTGSNLFEYIMRGRKYVMLSIRLLAEKHILHKIP